MTVSLKDRNTVLHLSDWLGLTKESSAQELLLLLGVLLLETGSGRSRGLAASILDVVVLKAGAHAGLDVRPGASIHGLLNSTGKFYFFLI